MKRLNLPTYSFNIKSEAGAEFIFDESRRKWVSLTPEEWVRQHILQYLIHEKNYPVSLIAVEMGIRINGLKKRCDLVVFNRAAEPVMIVECKAPEVSLNQKVFDQAARYNWDMQVPYLLISNGIQHYCARIDSQVNSSVLLSQIPDYDEVCRPSSAKS